jgi:hypothetical protein
MFTGLIQERGVVAGDPRPSGRGGVRLAVEVSAEVAARLGIGASLAVSGVCLTVVEMDRRATGGGGPGVGARRAAAGRGWARERERGREVAPSVSVRRAGRW